MTVQQFIRSSFTKVLFSLLMTALLVACGGGGSDSPVVPSGGGSDNPAVTISATITWTAPVAKADGSPFSLADIGGYRVYYGTSAGNYTNYINVDDGTAEQVILRKLPSGKHYFIVTVYDVSGTESKFSPVVTKTII